MITQIIIDGKKYKLVEEVKENKNHWARVEKYEKYYVCQDNGEINRLMEDMSLFDDSLYNNANYCTNKEKLERIVLEQTLNRKLERFRDENDIGKVDFKNAICKHYIYFDVSSNTYEIYDSLSFRSINTVYFDSRKIADKALVEFKEDFDRLQKYYENEV